MDMKVAEFLRTLATLAEPPTDVEKSRMLSAIRASAKALLVDAGLVTNDQQLRPVSSVSSVSFL